MMLRKIGVIGAGVIGVGVAQSLLQTGHVVVLLDVSDTILQRAEREIKNGIRLQSLLHKNKPAQNQSAMLGNIQLSTDYQLLHNVDFVIENVTEKWESKQQVYQQIDTLCPSHCIFAANTSAIPITRIASLTQRAEQVIGMHFMNPVPLKQVVEVIRGYHTSDATLERTRTLLAAMQKEGVVIHDSPGFVSNRILMLTVNEAIFLRQEGVATVEDIDRICKTCFEHKMGPLETADLIGLDTVLFSLNALYESFNDSKYRPCSLLKHMVDAGLYGRKSGQGFYSYAPRNGRQENQEGGSHASTGKHCES